MVSFLLFYSPLLLPYSYPLESPEFCCFLSLFPIYFAGIFLPVLNMANLFVVFTTIFWISLGYCAYGCLPPFCSVGTHPSLRVYCTTCCILLCEILNCFATKAVFNPCTSTSAIMCSSFMYRIFLS